MQKAATIYFKTILWLMGAGAALAVASAVAKAV